jgi:hypothetical protein
LGVKLPANSSMNEYVDGAEEEFIDDDDAGE